MSLNSQVQFVNISWTKDNFNLYVSVIEEINDLYKKMLMVGKCDEVFRLSNNRVPDILSAQTKQEYNLVKKNILLRYNRYKNTNAPMLNITIETDLLPNPRKYLINTIRPTNRMILLKEEILKHEFYTNSLNIKKCEICLECHIEGNQSKQSGTTYICQKCQIGKDPKYFLKNNLHPIWYEVDDNGQYIKDKYGNKIPHYKRPIELIRLSMAEKLLIQRCANYVPSVHLSNGTFALRGHCVTFPQDITAMCNEPLCKETMIVFIRYIGNKDTTAVYPKSLRVNRKNVLEALLWLKKNNPFYADVTIKEENLHWMQGEEEVSIATNAFELKTKNSKNLKIIADESEYVSSAHTPESKNMQIKTKNGNEDNSCTDIDISTMHANQSEPLPTGPNAEIIKSFINIAQTTGQTAKIMTFPPIDHDSPIR